MIRALETAYFGIKTMCWCSVRLRSTVDLPRFQCLLLYYAIMLGYIVFCSVILPWMYVRYTEQQTGGSLQFNEVQQVKKQYSPYKIYCFAIN